MRKWVALAVLAALVAGGLWLRGRYREAAGIARPHEVRDLTPAEIREGLRSDDLAARLDAIEQVDRLPREARRTALLEALSADGAPTRLTAVTALAERFPTDPAVVDALLETARVDDDADVRAAALRALETSGDPRLLGLALATLDAVDAPLAAKLAAARTLDRLTGRATAAPLAERLDAASDVADELLMDWDGWLAEHGDDLRWDTAAGRFVPTD